MADYKQIPSVDWLHEFKRNWYEAEHFVVDGTYLREKFWLLCDPAVDPTEAESLEDLWLIFFHPKQPIPSERFRATVQDGQLVITGKLDYREVKLHFKQSKTKPTTFYTTYSGVNIEFDIEDRHCDIFCYKFEYGDERVQKGDTLIYEGLIWKFVKWNDVSSGTLCMEPFDKADQSIIQIASVSNCLRLAREKKRTSTPKFAQLAAATLTGITLHAMKTLRRAKCSSCGETGHSSAVCPQLAP